MKRIFALGLTIMLALSAAFALAEAGVETPAPLADVTVTFGEGGDPYPLHLYDTDTAVELYRHVPESGQNLPIYDFNGYEGWEAFQYYDLPGSYEIPEGEQQLVAREAAGEVYYSAPNRLILFYQDAEIPMTMGKIGHFDDTPEFRAAVADNAPLEDWGNLIVRVERAE